MGGFKDKLPSGTSLTSGTVTATSPETTDDDDDDDEDAAEEQPAGKTVTQSLTFQDVDGKSQDVADAVKDALAAQDAALPTSTITVTEGEALDGKVRSQSRSCGSVAPMLLRKALPKALPTAWLIVQTPWLHLSRDLKTNCRPARH